MLSSHHQFYNDGDCDYYADGDDDCDDHGCGDDFYNCDDYGDVDGDDYCDDYGHGDDVDDCDNYEDGDDGDGDNDGDNDDDCDDDDLLPLLTHLTHEYWGRKCQPAAAKPNLASFSSWKLIMAAVLMEGGPTAS